MVSPNTLAPAKSRFPSGVEGFTIIEVLVALGITMAMVSLGLFISLDFYKSSSLQSEKSIIISVLQKARSQSLDNINEQRHGVRFFLDPSNGNKLTYLIFQCPHTCTVYPGTSTEDLPVVASYKASITNPSLPFDVVFDQLSGDCVSENCTTGPVSITLSDSVKSYNILINSEGGIDW